jgi:hypothetical protein
MEDGMDKNNESGPAFPATEAHGLNSGASGLTIRDYLAAKAMQALISASGVNGSVDYEDGRVAKNAYLMADAMLVERAA